MFKWIIGLFALHKPGQGMWSRGGAALGFLAMGTFAAVQTQQWAWVVTNHQAGRFDVGVYLPWGLFAFFAVGALLVGNAPRAANLLIETEIEMRKVTWPTWREVAGATAVVIVVVLILGFYLYGLDFLMVTYILKWLRASPITM